jgi:hypothetical protein
MNTHTDPELLMTLGRAFDSTTDEQVRSAVDYYLVARMMPDYCTFCGDRTAQYLPYLVQREPVGFVAAYRCPKSHYWTCRFGSIRHANWLPTCPPCDGDFNTDPTH